MNPKVQENKLLYKKMRELEHKGKISSKEYQELYDRFYIQNKGIVMSKELSRSFAKSNNVKMDKFLSSIHIFHEVISQEYKMSGHPYIHLHPDGSGCVTVPRYNKSIFNFKNLKEMVQKADELCDKYGIIWRK